MYKISNEQKIICLSGPNIHHPGSFAAEGIIVHKRRLSPALAFVDIRVISTANFNPDIGSQILSVPKLEIKLTGSICTALKKDAVKISKLMNQIYLLIFLFFCFKFYDVKLDQLIYQLFLDVGYLVRVRGSMLERISTVAGYHIFVFSATWKDSADLIDLQMNKVRVPIQVQMQMRVQAKAQKDGGY